MGALQHLVALAGGWQLRPPTRRTAYDSNATRRLRSELILLRRLQSLVQRQQPLSPGPWPHPWLQLIQRLQPLGITLPQSSVPSLLIALRDLCGVRQAALDKLNREMRQVRHTRWKSALPQLWQQRPAVIHHWLRSPSVPWGVLPIMDDAGHQCTTPATVDAAVRQYWVHTVLRHHATVDEEARWAAFNSSRFASHIPVLQWPSVPWSAHRVATVLRQMRQQSSPGTLGIPISVWRSLPTAWMASVARLLTLVEDTGTWPVEWLDAYVAMIPKAAGGSRPRDQRPITVLDVLYRIWSKGIVMEWTPVLQNEFLGPAAMGFRAQSGTLHVVQLLSDIITLQAERHQPLWLMSFDVEKCYDMLPWWALFRVLRRAGVRPAVVQAFQAFYQALRRRFRYGQVDGEVWHAANGLAQGCPASPDLLNILFEAFHRWARAAGLGVLIESYNVPSISFADDVALIATCRRDAEELVDAYLEWCELLGVNVTKVQLWCSRPGVHHLNVRGRLLHSSPTFKIVGVVLGASDIVATPLHFNPRLSTALSVTQRLRALRLPTSICSLLWRTAVLPKALYGCEVRDVRPSLLSRLTAAGRALALDTSPLHLNVWRSPELLSSPALGDTAILDPLLEVRLRQLHWLQLLVNLPGLVGTVHRLVASLSGRFVEPTRSLRSALSSIGWSVHRNFLSHRSAPWPQLDPEISYPGPVHLEPVDQFPIPGTVYTDGSILQSGGAAAFEADFESCRLVSVPDPRSSTHCELVALCLALTFSSPPAAVLTDSLASLQCIHSWGSWPTARHLQCADRVEVRQFLAMALELEQPPVLEKVKAHDAAALASGHPKSVGNDMADQLARMAAEGSGQPVWNSAVGPFGDPVVLLDARGVPVLDVRISLLREWWPARRAAVAARREWFANIYPATLDFDFSLSTGVFRRPTVSGGSFVHPAPPATIKWIGRLRTGCLATGSRRHTHFSSQVLSPACLCCSAPVEDDAHAVSGCPATGSADWAVNISEAWAAASHLTSLDVPLPLEDWLSTHRLPLLLGLIPASLHPSLPLPPADASRFLSHLHRALCQRTAELCRRRQELLVAAAAPAPAGSSPPPSFRPCPLPPERQLSAVDIRQLEVQRRTPASAVPPDRPPPVVPVCGEPRRRWLRNRLIQLITEDTVVCPPSAGAVAPCMLELFERVTGEMFSDTPGVLLSGRVRAIAKVMGNLVREVTFDPPLVPGRQLAYVCWNRCPRVRADWEVWRRHVESTEEFQAPVPRARSARASVDAELVPWVRRHLLPAQFPGESGMALLLLWEVNHGVPFPTQGAGDDRAAVLTGFTKRLRAQVKKHDELSQWLECKDVQQPLSPGLRDSHHFRWSVRIRRPPAGEPQGWYAEFIVRWRTYLATQVHQLQRPRPIPTADGEISTSSPGPVAPPSILALATPATQCSHREASVPASASAPPTPPPAASPPVAHSAPPPRAKSTRQRRLVRTEPPSTVFASEGATQHGSRAGPPAPGPAVPPARRQPDLRQWMRPRPSMVPVPDPMPAAPVPPPPRAPHGRAAQGPPT